MNIGKFCFWMVIVVAVGTTGRIAMIAPRETALRFAAGWVMLMGMGIAASLTLRLLAEAGRIVGDKLKPKPTGKE